MPLFYFDLFYDRYVVLDPGGLAFEYPAGATEAADELARDLLTARSELRKSGSWIRVRDERGAPSSIAPRSTRKRPRPFRPDNRPGRKRSPDEQSDIRDLRHPRMSLTLMRATRCRGRKRSPDEQSDIRDLHHPAY